MMSYYHINGLHQFWESFEWFYLQKSCDEKYFSSLVQGKGDRGLILVIIYYFQIWNEKEHNIIISRIINTHTGPMYIDRPYICISNSYLHLPE